MDELMKIAKEHVNKQQLQNKTKSINDYVFELLYYEGKSLTRKDIVLNVAIKKRAAEFHNEYNAEALESDIRSGRFNKTKKTVQNVLNQFASPNGKRSTLATSKKYAGYEFKKNGNELTIVKKLNNEKR